MSHLEKCALPRRTVLGGAAAASVGLAWGAAGSAAAHGGGWRVSQDVVDAETRRLERDLVALRRDLHRHPEDPGREERTAGVVARELRAAGLAVTPRFGGGHGVVGVLRGARPGRTVAYRADMDAVPAGDIVGGGTATAHACGHDIHTTVAVGIARVLARLRRHLRGTVVFVFQPAEERLAGAAPMIEAGVLDRHGVEEIHALHCGWSPVGSLAVTPGYGLPGQDRGVVTLSGPDAAGDARRLAAEIGALATVTPPQTVAGLERLVADIETPNGPLTRFVAARARAEGAAVSFASRCWPEERYAEVRRDVHRLAAAYPGASVTYEPGPFPALLCPAPDAERLARHLHRALGRDAVVRLHAAIPFSGEDYALFLDRIPGTYTFLGVHTPGTPLTTGYPHYPDFTPDERAIGTGVRAMAGWLAERAGRPRHAA